MARPQAFERDLRLATAGLEPDVIAPLLARAAKEALAAAQAEGIAPEHFVRSVNGRIGVPEESVTPPGPIVYSFNWLPDVAAYGVAFAKARSPQESGRFKSAWFVLANGAVVTDFEAIPLGAELIITNDEPYARRIEVGKTEAGRAFVIRVPPGIVEDTRQAVLRRFGNVIRADRKFINLAGGYVLQTNGRLALAKNDSRSVAHRGGRKYLASRKDRRAGRELTYPALVITQIF